MYDSDNGYDEDDETDSDSHIIVGKRATEVKLSLSIPTCSQIQRRG